MTDDREMQTYHSRAYHDYFEGYTEKETVDEKGRLKIVRVYMGDYYVPQMSAQERKERRRMFVKSYLLMVICYLLAGAQRCGGNLQLPAAAMEALLLFFLAYLGRNIFYLFTKERAYTVRVYRIVTEKLSFAAKGSGVVSWATAAALFGYSLYSRVFLGDADLLLGLAASVGFAVCGILGFYIYRLEKETTYIRCREMPEAEEPGRREIRSCGLRENTAH